MCVCVCVLLQETKSQLASTSKKLKQAREEGEQIRSDLKTMITQYQVLNTCTLQFTISHMWRYHCITGE